MADKYEQMIDQMPVSQQYFWKNFSLKVMVGEYRPEGFWGLDLFVSSDNHAAFIPVGGLVRILIEMMDKGLVSDKDKAGMLVVLGKTDQIHVIDTEQWLNTGMRQWDENQSK